MLIACDEFGCVLLHLPVSLIPCLPPPCPSPSRQLSSCAVFGVTSPVLLMISAALADPYRLSRHPAARGLLFRLLRLSLSFVAAQTAVQEDRAARAAALPTSSSSGLLGVEGAPVASSAALASLQLLRERTVR